MAVRQATAADLAALVRVINRAYVVEAHIFHLERTSAADVSERLARPNACFLVIDAQTVPPAHPVLAGAVYVETRGDRGYFGMLAVDPDAQGRGLGRELIRAAEAHCRAAHCAFMDIDVVDQRAELPGFYATLGFAPVGATPFADASATKLPVRLIHMTKPLTEPSAR
jgi:ribosomal protein S18 acetylase RimI-like enzyme